MGWNQERVRSYGMRRADEMVTRFRGESWSEFMCRKSSRSDGGERGASVCGGAMLISVCHRSFSLSFLPAPLAS